MDSMLKSLANKAGKRFGNFAQAAGKKYICEGDISTIKDRAIKAIQMMPNEVAATMLKASPLCAPGGSMSSMFGGKKAKTRKQKRKARKSKTRKH